MIVQHSTCISPGCVPLTAWLSSIARTDLELKYGVTTTAYDVVSEKENVFSYDNQSRVTIHIFNGSHLPGETDRSADAVLFNAVLHHAAEVSATRAAYSQGAGRGGQCLCHHAHHLRPRLFA